jgi:outer membrane protein OmpA-like peptidoglycan-associated protein
MKRFIFALTALATAFTATADVEGVKTQNVRLERNGDYMVVDMDVDMSDLTVKSNRAVLITPAIVNGRDSLNFASIGVYGRKRYYYYMRDGKSTLTGKTERSFRKAKRPDTVVYHSILPYQSWMEGSHLVLNRSLYGCCNTKVAEQSAALVNDYKTPSTEKVYFMPTFVYMRPNAEVVKSREIKGSAFIDFPVNQVVIYPDYRSNSAELEKIMATINSVREDKDVSITSLSIKGFASPEGTYQHNTYLAKERTAALMNYVQNLYHFAPSIVKTNYEPEDWMGLRKYIVESNIENKSAILDIIESEREPDRKEWKIRTQFPEQYAYLLKYVYPALRHSDYKVEYTVRSYSDIEEIKRVLATSPQKLSLEELYLVANSYESGSDNHHEVFEVAVRMFPNDEIANLNAANSAMQKRDMDSAKRYLSRAGNSAEAVYARGAYSAMVEDYQTARTLLKQAEAAGIAQATVTLKEIDTFVANNK